MHLKKAFVLFFAEVPLSLVIQLQFSKTLLLINADKQRMIGHSLYMITIRLQKQHYTQ